jgi:hypothetical protein
MEGNYNNRVKLSRRKTLKKRRRRNFPIWLDFLEGARDKKNMLIK